MGEGKPVLRKGKWGRDGKGKGEDPQGLVDMPAVLKCRGIMLALSVFHGIGPTILAKRWTLVSNKHRPNVAHATNCQCTL